MIVHSRAGRVAWAFWLPMGLKFGQPPSYGFLEPFSAPFQSAEQSPISMERADA